MGLRLCPLSVEPAMSSGCGRFSKARCQGTETPLWIQLQAVLLDSSRALRDQRVPVCLGLSGCEAEVPHPRSLLRPRQRLERPSRAMATATGSWDAIWPLPLGDEPAKGSRGWVSLPNREIWKAGPPQSCSLANRKLDPALKGLGVCVRAHTHMSARVLTHVCMCVCGVSGRWTFQW